MNAVQFILYYITIFINSLCLVESFAQISKKNFKLGLKEILILFVICLLIILNNYYMIVFFRIFCSVLITFIMEKLIFNLSFKETIINTLILTITCLIIEVFFSVIVFSSSTIANFNNSIIFKIVFTLLTSLMLLLIINRKFLSIIVKIKNSITDYFNFYIFCLLIIIFLSIICFFRGGDLKSIPLIIIAISSALMLFIFLNIIISEHYNIKILEDKNKNLNDSYKAYADTIEECRELKHNLKNDLYALKTSIPNDYQAQINKLIIKYNKEYEWINRIDEIPEGLQGVIYLKINEALRKKVKIILNTKKEVSTNDNDYMDLCSIVGLLIDNAIEASSLSKVKVIEINIIESKNQVYIKILNKFKNRIDVNKIGKKNYSTKVYKSGLGLNYIKKLNNSNIKVNFNIINDLFVTNVTYNQNKKA